MNTMHNVSYDALNENDSSPELQSIMAHRINSDK
jgi:hypothetical protein